MASWLVLSMGFAYLVIAATYLRDGDVGFAIAFLGYFIGNFGLFIASK